MAKGKTANPAQRLQVFHAHKKLKWTAYQIQRNLFRGQREGQYLFSARTIKKWTDAIDRSRGDYVAFLRGPDNKQKSGRKRVLSGIEVLYIKGMVRRKGAAFQMKDLYKRFVKEFYQVGALMPSLSTFERTVRKRLGLPKPMTRKRLEYRHRHQNAFTICRFIRRVAPFDHRTWADMDEMKLRPADFKRGWGYAQRGDPAEARQIVIGNRRFVVYACLVYHGFSSWQFHECNTNHTHTTDFIRHKVRPFMDNTMRGLIDNASQHHHDDVRAALDEAFRGVWYYSPAYTPRLKPIERAFSLIKRYLRLHEDEVLLDPPKWINKAFQRYSVLGPKGHKCSGFWNVYARMNQSFLAGQI